jgi:hypothetical protein
VEHGSKEEESHIYRETKTPVASIFGFFVFLTNQSVDLKRVMISQEIKNVTHFLRLQKPNTHVWSLNRG